MLKVILIIAIVAAACAQPTPVSELVLRQYLGDWYQMHANKASLRSQPNNSTCATVQYGSFDPTTVTVDNRYRQQMPTGDLDRTTGKAAITATTGVLNVTFEGIPSTFSYYVISLGPVVDGMYSYAVITDVNSATLYVLARDPVSYLANYDADVAVFLTAQGFTGDAAPIPTTQTSDCLWPKSFLAPVPVSELVISQYTGRYYQAFANKNTIDQSQRDSTCVTVAYMALTATNLTVSNVFRTGSPTGTQDVTEGFAYPTAETGVLAVQFNNVPGMFSYVVTKLGPVEDDQYSYAVITDKAKFSVFVLVRNLDDIDDMEEELLDYLEDDLGFDGLTNSPIKTEQSEECLYPNDFVSAAEHVAASMGLLLLVSAMRMLL